MIVNLLQALCLLIVVGTFVATRSRIGVLGLFILTFAYFYLGPYLAFMLGIPIYSGIDVYYLDVAMQVFIVALLALLLGTLATSRRRPAFVVEPRRTDRRFVRIFTLYPAQAILLFGVINAAAAGVVGSGLDKVTAIQLIGWSHYPTLTLVPCMMLVYMALVRAKARPDRAFGATVALFIAYGLISSERDFVLLGVPIYFGSS
jgi:hypothetical protein